MLLLGAVALLGTAATKNRPRIAPNMAILECLEYNAIILEDASSRSAVIHHRLVVWT